MEKGVRMSNTQLFELYKFIIRCEQRDGPPRYVMGRLKKVKKKGYERGQSRAIYKQW